MEEKTIKRKKVYEGKLINLRVDTVLLPDNRESSREVVEHPGAAAVVPVNEREEVYLVRQYRKPVEESMLEIPAGTLEKGEEPLECARRELKEEIGYEGKNITHLLTFYTSPGICSEIMHLYYATGLREKGEEKDKDEFIGIEKYSLEEAIKQINQGKIKDAKTIIGLILVYQRLKNNK